MLTDENYNITAVIDWQFARFVPACETFGPSLVTADLGKLYSASAGLGADDILFADSFKRKARQDLADLAGGSELVRLFHFGLASGLSRIDALGMIKAVLSLLDGETSEKELEGWIEDEWDEATRDPRLKNVDKLIAVLE